VAQGAEELFAVIEPEFYILDAVLGELGRYPPSSL
jgi:hypothetical protein